MDRRGLELSLNFLVILILSLVVFLGGLALVNMMMGFANQQASGLDDESKRKIESILNEGEQVAIPFYKKEVRMGKYVNYGVGIYNVLGEEKVFWVTVKCSEVIAQNGTRMPTSEYNPAYIDDNWHTFGNATPYRIENNEQKIATISVRPTSEDGIGGSKPGTYIFDVNVTAGNGYYDGNVHKLIMKVK